MSGQRKPCSALWQTPIIRSNGKVSFCLSDNEAHMDLGNVFEEDFLDVWLRPRANQYRIWHLLGKQKNLSVCSICTYYEAHALPETYWDEFESIMIREIDHLKTLESHIDRFFSTPEKHLEFDLTDPTNERLAIDSFVRIANELLLHKNNVRPVFTQVRLSLGSWMNTRSAEDLLQFLAFANGETQRLVQSLKVVVSSEAAKEWLFEQLEAFAIYPGAEAHLRIDNSRSTRGAHEPESLSEARLAQWRAKRIYVEDMPPPAMLAHVSAFFSRLKHLWRPRFEGHPCTTLRLFPNGEFSVSAAGSSGKRYFIGDSFFRTCAKQSLL